MINPLPIPGTDPWLEGNQNAITALKLVDRLRTALGHDAHDFSVDG
jgi:hypothetical protein